MGSVGKGLAYALGLGQLVVTVAMVLFYPVVSIEMYTYTPATANGTMRMDSAGEMHRLQFALGMPCLAASVAAAAFVSNTFTLTDTGSLGSDSYCKENLGNTGLWDTMFWFTVACMHAVAVLTMTTPVDLFAAATCVYLLVYFMCKVCQPLDESHSMTAASTNIVGYIAGMCAVMYCMPPSSPNRLAVLFVLGVLDYGLWIGHTWDRTPDRNTDLETVANCRLFWVCSASMCLAGLYGAWHDKLLVQIVQ